MAQIRRLPRASSGSSPPRRRWHPRFSLAAAAAVLDARTDLTDAMFNRVFGKIEDFCHVAMRGNLIAADHDGRRFFRGDGPGFLASQAARKLKRALRFTCFFIDITGFYFKVRRDALEKFSAVGRTGGKYQVCGCCHLALCGRFCGCGCAGWYAKAL